MATVVWDDAHGVIVVNFLLNGEIVNSEAQREYFKSLRASMRRVRSNLKMNISAKQERQDSGVHQNGRVPHVFRMGNTVASSLLTLNQHPQDFHYFGPMKEALRGKRYADDDEVKTTVWNWLHQQLAILRS